MDIEDAFAKIYKDFHKSKSNREGLSAVEYVSSIDDPKLRIGALCFLSVIEANAETLNVQDSETFIETSNVNDHFATKVVNKKFGAFDVIEILGSGAFGDVYKAKDSRLDRIVAIKVLRNSDSVTELQKEARIVANFEHPNIVPLYHFDVGDNDQPYYVSKYIEGQNLQSYRQFNRINFSEAAQMCASIADALDFAHGQGIVHSDIKPANVLVDCSKKVWLADFGLGSESQTSLFRNELSGTPVYMSPEQATGEAMDGRSDIFSLGIVLYELLTGENPFRGSSIKDVIEMLRRKEVPPCRQLAEARNVPVEIEAACSKALNKNPNERFNTAGDFAAALRNGATYVPKCIDVSKIQLSQAIKNVLPTIAKDIHEVWATQRIREGWQFGTERNDKEKIHPDLVPYEQLTDVERNFDSIIATHTIECLFAMGFTIEKGNMDR